MNLKNVVVTGAGGYIGSQLVKMLLESGYRVLGIDRYFFGEEVLDQVKKNKNFVLLKKDIRDLDSQDLKGWDAVCDLACLSNDPAGEIDPKLTYEINRDGRIHVAKIAKNSGVQRYIISSSCSVYGAGSDLRLDEKAETKPLSVYAKSTLDAEQANLSLNDENFSVTSMRNATVFGLSKRMRFDLVVNLMTLSAYQKKLIIVMGGGLQWRPLVHLTDVARAFIKVLESDKSIVENEIFNIGFNNFRIKDLAYIVREQLPFPVDVEIAPDDSDKRDYNVSFEKIHKILKFKPEINIETGVSEIYHALKNDKVDTSIKTITVKWYKHILESKQLVDSISLNERLI